MRADDPPVWARVDLVEEVRIGLLQGDDRYLFGEVRNVVSTPDGSTWVVDAQGPRVRIYDPAGRYVRDVSRPGEGPGEIASVMGIDVTPDGRVAVWDLRNGRVSLYRQDGEYDRMFRVSSGW
ncbi:MAG TPA: 6-bladed beta-propeller, partial [Longimicrobiales bacterium]|nr:6-bladed beta-propeller [Longimicrobiales bacterium]